MLLWRNGDPVEATVSDVGLLLRPPWWPAVLLVTALAAALALRCAAPDKPVASVFQVAWISKRALLLDSRGRFLIAARFRCSHARGTRAAGGRVVGTGGIR
jgi:hypothetical protein